VPWAVRKALGEVGGLEDPLAAVVKKALGWGPPAGVELMGKCGQLR